MRNLLLALFALIPLTVFGQEAGTAELPAPHFSLGQWSYHAKLFSGEMSTQDFIRTAAQTGFDGVELVNQFFLDRVDDEAYLDSLRETAEEAGIAPTMLLVDRAGELCSDDPAVRRRAVYDHLAWLDAAHRLGVPAMRVNAHGGQSRETAQEHCTESLGELADRAERLGIGLLVENHGGFSNDGEWMAGLMGELRRAGFPVGTVADFDNWCLRRDNGQLWGGQCVERYNRYAGMMDLMPFAGGVSVKAFDFDDRGEEPTIDFARMFDIIHAWDYDSYLGIEYEGSSLPPREGIANTLALAKRSWPRRRIVDDRAVDRIDSTLRALVGSGRLAGASALVYEKGEEAYFGAFGLASRKDSMPMDRTTIAQIYSMTKPLTGVALMQLYEAGKFDLYHPLADYLPEFADMRVYAGEENGEMRTRPASRPLRVIDILRHTAGFSAGADTPALQEAYRRAAVMDYGNSLDEMGRRLGDLPLQFEPRERWYYGPSVDVQALLVERLSGQPFDEYLREHVLDPLGMAKTRYFVPPAERHRMAASFYRDSTGTLQELPDSQAHAFNTARWELTPGGFGLTSTLDDYMTFARMLLNEGTFDGVRILEPETVRRMRSNLLPDAVTERHWLPNKGQVGFGIDFAVRERPPLSAEENPGTVGEFFWDGAASTLFWVDPANELAAVLFVQLFPFDPVGLHRGFRRAVYGPYRPTAGNEDSR